MIMFTTCSRREASLSSRRTRKRSVNFCRTRKVKFYIGFDPTADCLHVGHFMQVIIMMYMQKYGHTPVVLLGGGTGFVGDPSGRTDMRQMMTPETIENNCAAFKKLFDKFLDFDEDWKYEGNNGVFSPGHENKTPEPGKADLGKQREMAAASELYRIHQRDRFVLQCQHDAEG